MSKLTANQQRWQSIIEDWRQSGLSQAEYCRQHQLSPQRFYAWKHQLKLKPIKNKQVPMPHRQSGTFLPITWDHAEPRSESMLRIHCQGAAIEVTHTTDPELFKKAVQWLGGLS